MLLTDKEKNYKELENEKRLGKKRFLERMVEDEEAQQLIQDFLDNLEDEEKEQAPYEGQSAHTKVFTQGDC